MSLATIIEQTLGLTAPPGPEWNVDQRKHGPFAPLLYATETADGVHLVSSPLTQTEWWQTFMPTTLCPRYDGKLGIDDWVEPYCKAKNCVEACKAEDGFVELRANRFRLAVDAEIIYKRFPHLHEFLDRAEKLVVAHNQAKGMGWQLAREYPLPCLQVMVPQDYVVPHLQGLAAIFTLLTGVLPDADVEVLPPFDIEAIDIDTESGLMATAQYYGLLEVLRRKAEFLFTDLIAEKGGEQNGSEFKLASGLRYIVSTNVECYMGETGYMGQLEFKLGLAEIRRFIATTLGGGRW